MSRRGSVIGGVEGHGRHHVRKMARRKIRLAAEMEARGLPVYRSSGPVLPRIYFPSYIIEDRQAATRLTLPATVQRNRR